MYAREVASQVLSFGVSGMLFRNGLVMYDAETVSLWSQVLGKAIGGPLKGTKLTMLPSLHTSWGVWRREHPDGMLLKKEAPSEARYAAYWRMPLMAGELGETITDRRLPIKEFVLGVRVAGKPKAYPASRLSQQPVVNDTLGGTPLLVVFDVRSATSSAFSRQVQGQTLTFEPSSKAETSLVLKDQETGSIWHGLTGMATEGPLAGQRLTQVPATDAFWFGWKDHFPNTAVWGE